MRIKLILASLIFSTALIAQKANMGIHMTIAAASQGTQYHSNPTFGGGLSYHFYVNDYFTLGLEAFYLGYVFSGQDSSVNILPLQGVAALHWPISEGFEVYGGSGGGVYIQRYKSRTELTDNVLIWGLSPRAGFLYEFADNVSLDVHFQYFLSLTDARLDNVSGITTFNIGLTYNIFADM